MSSEPDHSEHNRGAVREQLINSAQVDVHEARADVAKARLLYETVPRELRMLLQEACVEYYYALRPLRSESIIKKWWSDVVLSEHWVKDVREWEEVVVDADLHGPTPDVRTETKREVVLYQGLDVLADLDEMTDSYECEVVDMCGTRVETGEQQVVLPARVLIDVSAVLDDAAKRLDFAPRMRVGEGSTGAI
jgi:hypothetical protein